MEGLQISGDGGIADLRSAGGDGGIADLRSAGGDSPGTNFDFLLQELLLFRTRVNFRAMKVGSCRANVDSCGTKFGFCGTRFSFLRHTVCFSSHGLLPLPPFQNGPHV